MGQEQWDKDFVLLEILFLVISLKDTLHVQQSEQTYSIGATQENIAGVEPCTY